MLLNDLDVSLSHLECLTKDIIGHPYIPQYFIEAELSSVKSAISSFSTLVIKFHSTLRVSSYFYHEYFV